MKKPDPDKNKSNLDLLDELKKAKGAISALEAQLRESEESKNALAAAERFLSPKRPGIGRFAP